MLEHPCFKPHYRVQRVDPDLVFLLSETERIALRGRLYYLLAPRLDGKTHLDDVVDAMADEAPAAELYYAVNRLEQAGHLVEASDALPPAEAAWWSAHRLDAATVAQRFSSASVKVEALGDVSTDAIVQGLEALHLSVTDEASFHVIVTDNYLHADLADWNRQAFRDRIPWMLVRVNGTAPWIGPLFVPDRTACWECLADRMRLQRPLDTLMRQTPETHTSLPCTVDLMSNLVVTQVARWLAAGENPTVEGCIVSLDALGLTTTSHRLTRRPQCAVCGNANRVDAEPVVLHGGESSATPTAEALLAKYEHLVSPITGVVHFLQRSEFSTDLTPVYTAGFSATHDAGNLLMLRAGLGGISAGRGTNETQAKASALGEAIERHCGVFRGDESRILGSLKSLGERAIHPNACMLFSDYQVRHRQEKDGWSPVPLPLDETHEMEWTPLWSLSSATWKYLPTAFCYYGYADARYCYAESNGNAAGQTRDDAILNGLTELIERDAIALWWYNRIPRKGVDLSTVREPYIRQLVDYYRSIQREVWVLDITADMKIPTFAAVSRSLQDSEDIIFGFAANANCRRAIVAALTEMNQCLTSVLQWHRDGARHNDRNFDENLLRWWRTATVQNQPFLQPTEIGAIRDGLSWHENARDNIVTCQKWVEAAGMELLVLDQTRADIGLPVVKVVVPGLRPFWSRFAPGRLYDVPVSLGWRESPLSENDMNPYEMFF